MWVRGTGDQISGSSNWEMERPSRENNGSGQEKDKYGLRHGFEMF